MNRLAQVLLVFLAACSVAGTTRSLAYYRKARLYARQGDYDRAIAYYDTTLKLFARPLATEVFIDRGEAYYWKGMYARAIADFDTALSILDEPRAYADRGSTYRRLGQAERGIPDLDAALRLEPKLTWARYSRAQSWRAMDSLERAIADLDTVLMHWKDRPDIVAERQRLVAWVRR